MKFELKTENDSFSKSLFSSFLIFLIIVFLLILYSLSKSLGVISKQYEINYLCRSLQINKSSDNFKRLSRLTNQTNKQNVRDFCREISRK